MAHCPFLDPHRRRRPLDRVVIDRSVEMVASPHSGLRIDGGLAGGT